MSPEEYQDWRKRLSQLWHRRPQLVALLKPDDQWRLHDYFQFHDYQDPAEALGWYFTLQECDPSVESNGLEAFKQLQRAR